MTLNGVMTVTLCYFSEVGKPALQKTICGGICARVYCILVRVQCRRKESSRSLSHLLMNFLFFQSLTAIHCFRTLCRLRCTWRQHADIWTSPECLFTTVPTSTVETWNSPRPFTGFVHAEPSCSYFLRSFGR